MCACCTSLVRLPRPARSELSQINWEVRVRGRTVCVAREPRLLGVRINTYMVRIGRLAYFPLTHFNDFRVRVADRTKP